MEQRFIKFCFILMVFTQQSISQRLKSVTRKTHVLDLDRFMFEENCDGVCSGTGGYGLERCACSCQQEAVFVISQKRCVKFEQVDRYILSTTSPTTFADRRKISKFAISSLQGGIGLYYCNSTSCDNNFKQCQINSAYIDRSQKTLLWNQNETQTITISNSSILKVNVIPQNEYSGQLLTLNIVCLQDGSLQQQITGQLLIEVAGTYEIPVITTTTTPATTTTTTISTTISTTTTAAKTSTATTTTTTPSTVQTISTTNTPSTTTTSTTTTPSTTTTNTTTIPSTTATTITTTIPSTSTTTSQTTIPSTTTTTATVTIPSTTQATAKATMPSAATTTTGVVTTTILQSESNTTENITSTPVVKPSSSVSSPSPLSPKASTTATKSPTTVSIEANINSSVVTSSEPANVTPQESISTTTGAVTSTMSQSESTITEDITSTLVVQPSSSASSSSSSSSSSSLSPKASTTSSTSIAKNTNGTADKGKLEDDDEKMLLIYIITPSAVALVIILCIIALLCRRCSRRQRRRKHRSEPVSLFQPTTPIFLVDRRRSDLAFTGISDPLYDLSNDSKKAVTMKHTYAQVGKKIKKKNKGSNSADGSLDDGYNTDEGDYYRRFSAFPTDVYSFPGSVASLNEPEYRIPEDLNYLADNQSPPYSSYHQTSIYRKNGYETKNEIPQRRYRDFPEDRFSSFKSSTEENLNKRDSQYDEVGAILQNQVYNSNRDSFYDEVQSDTSREADFSSFYTKPLKKLSKKIIKEKDKEMKVLFEKDKHVKLVKKQSMNSQENEGYRDSLTFDDGSTF